MEEVEYLRAGSTVVTSTRIEIDGQTFAVRNVGSVKVTRPSKPWVSVLLAVVLIAMALVNFSALWFLALVGAGLGAYAIQQMQTRRLVLVSGGGETIALTSTNAAAIARLRDAVAQAIAAR